MLPPCGMVKRYRCRRRSAGALCLLKSHGMKELFVLVVHLLAVLIKLVRPGGVRSVVAESLLLSVAY
jgi:hypothetical protein